MSLFAINNTYSPWTYYRTRNYNPNSGRFISEDPIGFGGEDFNLYRYVEKNPVLYFDPEGLAKKLPTGGSGPTGLGAPSGNSGGFGPISRGKGGGRSCGPKQKNGTPKNNQAQNKQFKDATKGLNKKQKRIIHDEISGKNKSFQQIKDLADLLKKGGF
ncbi:MAG: RHS repeat-associated protein [Bacteriovoracaceae bacterium]|jgi:RHS repeat-associated protein